jgi:hypothetical protein
MCSPSGPQWLGMEFAMRSLACLFVCLVFVARADGVIIGHPVTTQFAPGTGLTYTSGSISVTDQIVYFCNGSQLTIPVDDVLSLGDTVLLPATGWVCAIDLQLLDDVLLSGTGAGGSFTLSLDVPVIEIEVDPPVYVASNGASDADVLRLGAPNFVTATLLQLGPGITRNVGPGHALHDGLAASIRYDGAILE